MSSKTCVCGKRTPEQPICYHDYHVCDHRTCTNHKTLSHKHGPWMFDCSAWSTKQEPNHSGEGGNCVGMAQYEVWNNAVGFYANYGKAEYCRITAHRFIWDECGSQSVQYFTCYLHCTGCALTNAPLRCPPSDCVT